jgi:hypothetical protein
MNNNQGQSQHRNYEESSREEQQLLHSSKDVKFGSHDLDDLVHTIGIEKSKSRDEVDADEAVHKMRPSAPSHPNMKDPDDLVHGE